MENKNSKSPILVIEFDPVLSDLICVALQRNGYLVLPFKSAEGVLELLQKAPPTFVILDLFIPGCDTHKFLTSIKSSLSGTNGKVIVLSSMGFNEVIEKAKENGADVFVNKPFDVDVLIEVLRGSGDKK
jgi:DNA-binding response OmpR family regulator